MPTIEDALAAYQAEDFTTARAICTELADHGHPGAMQLLGRLCADDPGQAAHWFFQAWQNGLNTEQDIVRVRADLEAAAEGGSAVAQNALGLILTFGEDDPAAAAPWFEKAAAQDHPEAMRSLGYLLGEGKGVPKDDVRAAGLYRRAAELGDAYAQLNLAGMIDQGLGGLKRDVSEAIEWFRRAAQQGLRDANQRLAELLAERNQDRRDAAEAVERITRVAASSPVGAEFRLAASDGSWSVTAKRNETAVAVSLVGLGVNEIQGLIDES